MRSAMTWIFAISTISVQVPMALGGASAGQTVLARGAVPARTTKPDAGPAAAFERSRHLLLDVRPFDFTAWKAELGIVHAQGSAVDGAIAWECRRCAILLADSLPADSILQVVETAVELRESMAFDDSLIAICDRMGRQPLLMRLTRERAGVKREDEPSFGEYVQVDELPEAISKVAPEYPAGTNADGTVLVQALVGKDGRVHDVKVVKSIPALDEAATKSVRQWVFKPALAQGQPTAVWVAVPVMFKLGE